MRVRVVSHKCRTQTSTKARDRPGPESLRRSFRRGAPAPRHVSGGGRGRGAEAPPLIASSVRAGNGGTGERSRTGAIGTASTVTSHYNIVHQHFRRLNNTDGRRSESERASSYVVYQHALLSSTSRSPSGASRGAFWGVQLWQSTSDGQRKVVGISLCCSQVTRPREPRAAVLPRPKHSKSCRNAHVTDSATR